MSIIARYRISTNMLAALLIEDTKDNKRSPTQQRQAYNSAP